MQNYQRTALQMSIRTDKIEAVSRNNGVIFGRTMKILNLMGIYIPVNL